MISQLKLDNLNDIIRQYLGNSRVGYPVSKIPRKLASHFEVFHGLINRERKTGERGENYFHKETHKKENSIILHVVTSGIAVTTYSMIGLPEYLEGQFKKKKRYYWMEVKIVKKNLCELKRGRHFLEKVGYILKWQLTVSWVISFICYKLAITIYSSYNSLLYFQKGEKVTFL